MTITLKTAFTTHPQSPAQKERTPRADVARATSGDKLALGRYLRRSAPAGLCLKTPRRVHARACDNTPAPGLSPLAAHRLMMATGFGPDALLDLFRALPPHERDAAAKYIAEHGNVHSRRALLPLLAAADGAPEALRHFAGDAATVVRYRLARVLRDADDKHLLMALAEDADPWVRQAAADGLVGAPEALGTLLRLARSDPSAAVRRALVAALAVRQAPGKAALLQVAGNDPSAWVRAASYAAWDNDASARQHLQERVTNEQAPWASHVALRELAKRDAGAAIAVAFQKIRRGPTRQSAGAAARLMLRYFPATRRFASMAGEGPANSEWGVLTQQDILHQSKSASLDLCGALYALQEALINGAALDPDHALSIIDDLTYRHPWPTEARDLNLHVAMKKARHDVVFALEQMRRSTRPENFDRAARLLWVCRGPQAVAMLHDMLDDGPEAQDAAAFALGQLVHSSPDDGVAIAQAFERLAFDRSRSARVLAPLSLGRLASPPTDAMLALCLRDPDPEVREASMWPAAHRGTPELFLALSALAHDPDVQVRIKFAQACRLIKLQGAGMLARMLADPSTEVREAVAESLMAHVTPEGLRALDRMATTSRGEMRHKIDTCRSKVLTEAWEKHGADFHTAAMLQDWPRTITAVHPEALYQLARSPLPRRMEMLQQFSDSPYAQVRMEADKARLRTLEHIFLHNS